MKTFFQWTPLQPPCESGRVESHLANRVALLAGGMGLAMVLLGLDSGLALYLPMLASVFLFGLPHGAIDHLVILGLAQRKLTLGGLLLVCAGYLFFVGAVLLLWWCSPLSAVILFLVITIYHWGKADLAFEMLLAPQVSPALGGWLRFNHILLRGFLPIGIPFLSFPESTEVILNACCAPFGYQYVSGTALQSTILCSLLFLFISELVYLYRYSHQWKLRIIESIGLLGFFCWVPPVLAVGLYFCFWHGFRHVLRLICYEEGGAINDSAPATVSIAVRFKRFFYQALPFTLASVLIVFALARFLPALIEPSQYLGIYLVVISSLTVPHLLVVAWMDRREGV